MPPTAPSWSTIEIRVEGAQDPACADALDAVGSRIAMDRDVDGVQTLDPKYDPVSVPGLLVYTRPAALGRIEALATTVLQQHGLVGTLAAQTHSDTQWQDLWKQYYRPLRFGGGTLLVRPSWIERTPDDPELEIVLDPGRAFGTGLHPTTQLCLERLCTLRTRGVTPASCLDLGCGSGILILAAVRLFGTCRSAVAIDIDPEATETTRENAAINGLTERVDARCTNLESLTESPFDMVVANIRPEVLIPLAARLREVVAPGGHLTVSGILRDEGAEVLAAFEDAGWARVGAARDMDDWTAFDFEHAP